MVIIVHKTKEIKIYLVSSPQSDTVWSGLLSATVGEAADPVTSAGTQLVSFVHSFKIQLFLKVCDSILVMQQA